MFFKLLREALQAGSIKNFIYNFYRFGLSYRD